MGGKKQTENTREAWDTTQFLEFVTLHLTGIDVDVILDTCSTIEILIYYHNISSTYQNAPGPYGQHTNVKKVGSDAAITELLHVIGSTVYIM